MPLRSSQVANFLANDGVPRAMLDAYTASTGRFGDRLIAALRADRASGGEAGRLHSAGLLIVDTLSWPIADLRCDWTELCPVETLAAALGGLSPPDAGVCAARNRRQPCPQLRSVGRSVI